MKKVSRTEDFEKALKEAPRKKYVLRLYVAGASRKSSEAIAHIKKICEEHLKGLYELQVIDIYQQPVLAKGRQIIAVPTLVKELPVPLRRFIGSMADEERILVGLDLVPKREDLSSKAKTGVSTKEGKDEREPKGS
ncbi:MAG TPA: circadian clock KaiB family protein [Syntrophorhabdaceae bacterium]|jgi:circadian clock protein KaiB